MFKNHQPVISTYARKGPDNMARVLKFVVLTIRTRLANIPADMETLDTGGRTAKELPGILYGWKADSIAQIEREAESLYEQAEMIWHDSLNEREAAESLLPLFAGIKGLGLAKAGFACQLIYGVSGCLDSHNIARFNIDPNEIRSSSFKGLKTLKSKAKKIKRYCDLVDSFGGTESLWDSWCEHVFNNPDETGIKMNGNNPLYKSVNHVSALHCVSLGLA